MSVGAKLQLFYKLACVSACVAWKCVAMCIGVANGNVIFLFSILVVDYHRLSFFILAPNGWLYHTGWVYGATFYRTMTSCQRAKTLQNHSTPACIIQHVVRCCFFYLLIRISIFVPRHWIKFLPNDEANLSI